MKATGRLDRKCRSCGEWSSFLKGDDADECVKCRQPYGKIVLGLDVTPRVGGRPRR